MAQVPNGDMTKLHSEVLEHGGHLFQQLGTRDMPSPERRHSGMAAVPTVAVLRSRPDLRS